MSAPRTMSEAGLDPSLSRVEWDEAPMDFQRFDVCEHCGCVVCWFAGYFGQTRPDRVVCVDCQREYGGEG